MLETSAAGRAAPWVVLAVAVVAIAADNATALPHVFGGGMDRFMHAYIAFAATLWAAVFLWSRVLTGKGMHPLLVAAIVACFGLALGTVWEIGEWGYNQIVHGKTMNHQTDTILDLAMDLVGAGTAGWRASGNCGRGRGRVCRRDDAPWLRGVAITPPARARST